MMGLLGCSKNERRSKIERVQLILLPPLIFIGGIVLYNTFLFISPPPLTVTKTELVEALEAIDRISPNRKNGLLLNQVEPLSGGGSSRLVVSHPAEDGDFILAEATFTHDFLYEKFPPDRMLHIEINTPQIKVESNGQPVKAILLLPRYETNPLRIEGISLRAEEDILSRLFAKQTIQPAPKGKLNGGKFVSNNGMTVDTGIGVGSGVLNLGGSLTIDLSIDSESTAWVEMPKNTRILHMAVGASDLNIGLLIPTDGDSTKSYQVKMFDEVIADISLESSGGH